MPSNNPWDGSGGASGGGSNPWSGASGATSSGSGNPWDGSGGVTTPPKPSKPSGGGGLLSTVAHGVGDVAGAVKGIATGTAGLAVDAARYPAVLVSAASKGKLMDQDYIDAQLAKKDQHLAGYLGVGGPGQGTGWTQTFRDLGGKGLLSQKQQATTVSPGKAYGDNPLLAALNDASNIATVTGPAAEVAGTAAAGAEAGSTAARLAKVAKVADTAANPVALPFKGARAALGGIGERAIAAGAESPGVLQQLGTKLTPAYSELKNAVLEGKAQENAVRTIVRQAPDSASAVEALNKAGYGKVADTVQAAAAQGASKGTEVNAEQAAVSAVRANSAMAISRLSSAVDNPEDTKGLVRVSEASQGHLPDTGAYLPKGLADQIKPYFSAPNQVVSSGLLSAMDIPNRALYTAKLGISPAPIVGRLGGHTALALGASSPAGVVKNIARIIGGKVKPEELADMPARVGKAAPIRAEAAEQAADVAGKTGLLSKATSAANTVANKSPIMRVASKMDDTIRKAAYLSEKQGGATAPEAAQKVLRAFGEFDALKPVERDVVRRLVPFYNWHKQIGLIASHLAEDHPARAELLAHLGDVSNRVNQDQGLPEGEIKVGGHLIDPGFLMPFGEAGTTTKVGGLPMASPAVKAAVGLSVGVNPNTGKPFSGPLAKVAGVDYRHAGVIENLRKALPQVNLADAITGRSDVVRYNDGSPVVVSGKTIPTQGNWVDALTSFAGLRSENAQAGQQRQASLNASDQKNAQRAAKALAKYQAATK